MATVYYPAIIERAGKGYSVFFPDLPGCTSAGDTIEQAARNAEEALAGHLLVSREHEDEIAPASPLDKIEHDPEVDEVARLIVRAEMPGRPVRVNVMLDEALIAAIDKVAGARGRSRFLADAARASLMASQAL